MQSHGSQQWNTTGQPGFHANNGGIPYMKITQENIDAAIVKRVIAELSSLWEIDFNECVRPKKTPFISSVFIRRIQEICLQQGAKVTVTNHYNSKHKIVKICLPFKTKLQPIIKFYIIIMIGEWQIGMTIGPNRKAYSYVKLSEGSLILERLENFFKNDYEKYQDSVNQTIDKYYITAKNAEIARSSILSLLKVKNINYEIMEDCDIYIGVVIVDNYFKREYYNQFLKNPAEFISYLDSICNKHHTP